MVVVRSDTPEEATTLLKGPMEKLRRVELAKSYVELLKDVDEMKKEARSFLPGRPKEALVPYIKLKELSLSMVELQRDAEGAAPHLVNYVQGATSKLWDDMKRIMADEFEAILRATRWPEVAQPPSREWQDCFEKLLDLQSPEIMSAREPLALLPMTVLAKNFVSQFRYHFFTPKATNQIHRLGEFFFPWFLGTVEKWQDYLREFVGPVLAAHFRGNLLAGNPLYVDPVAAFITALLPVMKEKVDAVALEVSSKPNLLSRFIPELMAFDEKVRSQFDYDGGNPEAGWKGLTWDVLNVYFDNWLDAEKMFVVKRYEEIHSGPDRGQIDFDGAEVGKTKPTYGATKVGDLLHSVTQQYKGLRRFSHKIRFFVEIQSYLLDQYFGVLNDSLSVYLSSITTVGRTLHGISKEEQANLEGIGGLDRLCRMYGSADRIIFVLREWSCDEHSFPQSFKPYFIKPQWRTVGEELVPDPSTMAITPELDSPLQTIKASMSFLNMALAYSTFRRVWRAAFSNLQTLLFNEVLVKQEFTSLGAARLMADINAIHSVVESSIGFSRGSISIEALGMPKLREGIELLNLPLQADEGKINLKDGYEEIFYSREKAAETLAKLGLNRLSTYEAKLILQHRVEARVSIDD
ncbi:putative RAD50-interacting protein 1 [Glarea lozoyensis 74030]|uniref:Putative RAD50-interacting protein 1 n=1 Tax=Glarea lozoyensis (strain ATCC 74030 / MF5533) TaxID=1104152 RepID=H0EL30_GLAL7|nr:putative RAD50-interacting protein 1 [Glarea lozoyensis 74030]